MTVAPGLERPALLQRIGDLNRSRFLPVIERVLGEYEQPGALLRIDRLDVDLGRVGEHELAGLEERLASALRAALNDALAAISLPRQAFDDDPPEAPAGAVFLLPRAAGLLAAFEHYLLNGTWPYGAAVRPDTGPAACLAELLADDPVGLVGMLRRRGRADRVLHRLVRQIAEAELRALLHRLEPAHAHYVLDYLDEVRARHEAEPLVPATREELRETLWTIVLRDALTQTGLQANRKAFLRRLLLQLANESGAPVGALVLQLRRDARRLELGRHEAGSLIQVLAELVAEAPELLPRPLMMAELSDLLGATGRPKARAGETRQMLATASRTHRGPLRWLLRRRALEDPHNLAQRIEGLLPLNEALRLLCGGDDAALAEIASGARTVAERAELLRLAATDGRPAAQKAGRSAREATDAMFGPSGREDPWPRGAAQESDPIAAEPAAVARLARLFESGLNDDDGAGDAIIQALACAQQEDAIATRRLLRDHAVSDARRLRLSLDAEGAGHRLADLLLPRHLADVLTALAAAAACTQAEWDVLLVIAGQTSESELPEALAEGAVAALARARGASAAALRRQLAAAPGREAETLRRALGGRGGDSLSRRYSALDRLAALWGSDAPFSAAERSAAIGRLLPSLTGIPPALLRERLLAAGLSRGERLLALLPPHHLHRLALLLMPQPEAGSGLRRPGPVSPAVIRSLVRTGELPPDPPPARAEAVRPTESEREVFPVAGELMAGGHGGAGRPRRFRRGESLTDKMGSVEWAAMLRTRPSAAIRWVAERDPEALGKVLPRLLAAPQTPALLFSALAPAERERSLALGRMLTGRAGRLAIGTAKVARALAIAIGSQEWRGGPSGFPALWMRVLKSLASLSEQATLARLLGPQWADSGTKAAGRAPEVQGEAVVIRLVRERPRGAAAQLRKLVRDPQRRAKIVRALPEADLVRLVTLIAPARASGLVTAGERILEARRAAGASVDRVFLHQALVATAADKDGDVCLLLRLLLDGAPAIPPPAAGARDRVEKILGPMLTGAGDAPLRAALELRRDARRRAKSVCDTARKEKWGPDPAKIHLGNAGLVLASAFLPRLFSTLDFLALDPSGRSGWRNAEVRGRAVHLLQWLADGRCEAPEPQLALNKLLCGMHPSEPVMAAIVMTEAERKAAEMLTATILASWPPLRGSSVEALRETFLRRHGKLTHGGSGWVLEVETKVIDILLDRLPWGYSTILHPWMAEPINVRWG